MLRQIFICSLVVKVVSLSFLLESKAIASISSKAKYQFLLSQAPPTSVDLNPNPDPLVLPTSPEEVKQKTVVPLTLFECIELAKRNNRQYQIAKLQLEQSRAQLEEAEAALFPTLRVEGSAQRQLSAQGEIVSETQLKTSRANDQSQVSFFSNQIETLTGQLQQAINQENNVEEIQLLQGQLSQAQQQLTQAQNQQQYNRSRDYLIQNYANTTIQGTLSLNYAIFSPERQATINIATEILRQSELEVQRVEEQLRLDVTEFYYDLELADEQVRISQSDVDSRAQRLEQIQQLLEAALVTRLDLLNAQVELGNSRQQLKNAQAQQQIAQSNLIRLLSLPFSVVPQAADEVKIAGEWSLSLEESIILAFKNRVELEQTLALRRQRQGERNAAIAAIQPRITIFADYNVVQLYSDQPDIDPDPPFAGANYPARGFGDGYAFGIIFSWTFFDGGAAQARARQAEIGVSIADQTYADNAQQIRAEVQQAYIQLPTQRENVETAQIALENAQEAVIAAQLRFDAAINTQTEVLDAQNRLVQAENNLVQAIISYNRALAQLQRAVGNYENTKNIKSSRGNGVLFNLRS